MIKYREANLRRVEKGDFWQLLKWHNKEFLFIFSGFGMNISNESLKFYFEKRNLISFDFIIETNDGKALGVCSYYNIIMNSRMCEVNLKVYDDRPPFNISTDALKGIKNYLHLELNLRRAQAFVPSYFKNEIKSYEGAGFYKEGALRQRIFHKGDYADLMVYNSML